MNGIFQVKNRRLFLVIYLIILVAWLAFIFGNSLADGERSSQQSGMVVAFIQSIVDVFDSSVTVDPVLVRNLAHYLEFFVLGALYCIGTFFIKAGRVSLWLHSIALSLFTAFTDETVQLFSAGRGSDVRDIWTDFLGALTAHLVIFALWYTYKHFKTASK